MKLDGYQCVIGVTELIFHENRRGFLAGYFFIGILTHIKGKMMVRV